MRPSTALRVLHLTSGNLYGGIERVLTTIACERTFAPCLEMEFGVCFAGRQLSELRSSGSAVHELGPVRVSRPWTVLQARRRLHHLLRTVSYDVVIVHGPWSHAVFAPTVRSSRCHLMHWMHGPYERRHWLERWAACTPPAAIIANSHYTAKFAKCMWPTVPVRVIACPVAAGITSEASVELRSQVRKQMRIPSSDCVILHISRMEPLKGHTVLLDALAQLRRMSDWRCWIVGAAQRPPESEYEQQVRLRATELNLAGRIHFWGQRPDVETFLAAADVFVQSNTHAESFGLTFIEAMYAGLPVVTSSIGGGAEIVTELTGLLVPPSDPSALADALQQLIRSCDLRRRLGSGGPYRATALCSPASRLLELQETVRAVVEGQVV